MSPHAATHEATIALVMITSLPSYLRAREPTSTTGPSIAIVFVEMRSRWLPVLVALAALGGGCDASSTEPPPSECLPPNRLVGERCLEPGMQDDRCPAGTLGLKDGSCQPAGIPPELCGTGFEPDGNMGCEPILPPEPCPAGQMAVPGESVCHAVMECGAGRWGDIPVDATTVYVDASYPGLDSDGSSDRPFTTISDAVAAAASGTLIAVAAGSYVEGVVIQFKTLRLWGKCPGEVELLGTGDDFAALVVREGASGTEVHGLALGGASLGLAISAAKDVLIDRVWVHDALDIGVTVESALGPTSATLRGSLVERNQMVGVQVAGSDGTLEGVLVRDTLPWASGKVLGRGINIQPLCPGGVCNSAARSSALVRGSLVERNHESGVRVAGSDATFESLVVRGTLPTESDQRDGDGILIQLPCTPAGCDAAARAKVLLRGSLVEQNQSTGVVVMGSDATLEGVLVRGTLPQQSDQIDGHGVHIQLSCTATGCDPAARATVLVRGSLLEQNHAAGVFVSGSDATLEGVLVRGTLPQQSDQLLGRGIHIQPSCTVTACDPAARATAFVRGSLVEWSHDIGVMVGDSDATIEGVLIRNTLARLADGLFGDGFSIFSELTPTSATVTQSRIEASARAGLSNFGSTVALAASTLACNAFDLAGETHHEQPFRFEDRGDNACGCPAPALGCKVQSVGLEPPEPITESTQ